MGPKDKVLLSFWANGLMYKILTSQENAEEFRSLWLTGVSSKMTVSGTINDIDANILHISVDLTEVDVMEIMETNRL